MKATKKDIGKRLKKHNRTLDKTYFFLVTDVTIKGKFILTPTDENFKNRRPSFISETINTYEVVK